MTSSLDHEPVVIDDSTVLDPTPNTGGEVLSFGHCNCFVATELDTIGSGMYRGNNWVAWNNLVPMARPPQCRLLLLSNLCFLHQ